MRKSVGLGLSAAAVIATAMTPAAGWAAVTGAAVQTSTLSGPAGADPNTTVTFTVTVGALAMTAPAAANLGSGAPGTTISGAVGIVTVTDSRALLSAAWTATASSSDYTTGAGTGNETIPVADATYTPGVITHTGTLTTAGSNITVSGAAQTVVVGSAGVGNNSASWNPTIAVAVPAQAVGGVYTSTLTQSVS